ncbi:sugar nucleotide-binding protein [bacterium]|nr:sugar nucleotide-binding protein [bacterium]
MNLETSTPSFEFENKIQRVFIIGVSSYIGSALAIHLRDDFEVFGTYFTTPTRIDGVTSLPLDCYDGNEILAQNKRYSPDAIIFCAGFNDKVRCQLEPGKAEALNFNAAAIFFKLLASKMRFIYFSTDEIFAGDPSNAGPFSEQDTASPSSVWAKTKFQGESLATHHKAFTATFRLGKVYGETMGCPLYPKQNWINSVSKQLIEGEEVPARINQIRSYTYIGDIARSVKNYLNAHNKPTALYNLASTKSYSEHDFISAYAQTFKLDTNLIKKTKYTPPLPREGYPEPLNCSLNSGAIKDIYNFVPQNAEEGLLELKNRLHQGWTKKWS